METTLPFEHFKLNEQLLDSLKSNQFFNTSAIQELTLQPLLDGKDIFAQAETGSGKTGAFAIPILNKILESPEMLENESRMPLFIVLSPTRELSQQTHKVFTLLGKALNINSISIIGGESIEKQKQLLAIKPHILIATPGRLRDIANQKIVSFEKCRAVVFDEADRLFDMGFQKDIEAILKMTPKDRQLIMLSATTNIEVMNMAYKFNSVPEELVLNHDSLLVDNIDHHLALIDSKEKMPLLVNLLRKDEDSYVIVFCNTQIQTHLVAEWLTQMGFKAEPISGKLAQNRRTRVMDDFRARKTNILVCTDVAARGLDIKDIQLVINFDLPSEAANYVHRIGRTGRAGKQGKAISFCSYEDCEFLDAIYELIDSKIPKLELTEDDFSKDVCRKPYIDFKTLKVRDNSSKQGTDNKNRKSNNMETRPNTRNERSERKPERNNDRKPTRTIETRNEKRPERKKTFNKAKKKLFTIDSYSLKTAKEEASVFFKIHDKSLLQYNILKTGRKKYFIFGEKLTSYQFEVRPIYKKILLPFFINIIKLAKLRLYVKISYNSSTSLLNINFSGEDEKMLLDNKIEFLEAFDQLAKTYLVNISPDIYRPNTKIYFGQAPKNQRDSSGRNERDNDQNKKRVLDMVKKSIDQISQEKPSMAIGPLDSYQRRLVHQFISDDGRYETTSIGDGRMKKIEISLK